MTGLTIATWNINSVRLRAPLIANWVEEASPDILCLQEIKCEEHQFPYKAFKAMGYDHVHVTGQKGMHGVATVSRFPIEPLDDQGICAKAEARHQRCRIEGLEIQNYYIPAGGDEPDPDINPRFAHKLEFVDRLAGYFGERASDNADIIAVGDFNIAPKEHDVWSHKQLLKVVSHTPVEVEKLDAAQAAGDFIDIARALIPEEEKVYTWWSYRNRDWTKSNRGRRLDHIWASPSLKAAVEKGGRDAFRIWDHTRSWEKPSDHAPVTWELHR